MRLYTIPDFLKQAVFYEVNTRQFSPNGNFEAVRSHLERLKAMGVNVLWFMPLYPIGQTNRKGTLGSYYSIRDFQAVNPEFGSEVDFRMLIDEAHGQGFKIVLDWVANHTAWDHKWTESHPLYYVQKEGAFQSPFDWTDVIQLDYNYWKMRRAMIESMSYWLNNFDIDGFRCDMAHLVPLEFWKEARTAIDKLKPNLIWLAETEDAAYTEVFDITYTWEWMHATERYFKNPGDVQILKDILLNDTVQGLRLYFTSNHDENSWNGTEFEKYGIYALSLAVFSALYPNSIPLIYNGQEIPNHKRLQFFDKDALNWPKKPALQTFYTDLLQIRKNQSKFFVEKTDFGFIENTALFAFYRKKANACMTVVLNWTQESTYMHFPENAETLIQHDARIDNQALFIEPGGFWVGVQ